VLTHSRGKGAKSVSGKLAAVKRGGRQTTERSGNTLGGDRGPIFPSRGQHQFRQHGSGGDGGNTSLGFEANFGSLPVGHADGEPENVTANGVGDFDGCRCVSEFPRIAWMVKVIEDSFAKHREWFQKF